MKTPREECFGNITDEYSKRVKEAKEQTLQGKTMLEYFPSLCGDIEFMKSIDIKGCIPYIPTGLRDDSEFMLKAIAHNSKHIRNTSKRLQKNDAFVKQAMKTNPDVYQYLRPGFLELKEYAMAYASHLVVVGANRYNRPPINVIPIHLRNDNDIILKLFEAVILFKITVDDWVNECKIGQWLPNSVFLLLLKEQFPNIWNCKEYNHLFQDKEFMLQAVGINPECIKEMKTNNITKEIAIEVVKQKGDYLRFCGPFEQDVGVITAALAQNGMELLYYLTSIKDGIRHSKSEIIEMCRAALKQNKMTREYIAISSLMQESSLYSLAYGIVDSRKCWKLIDVSFRFK